MKYPKLKCEDKKNTTVCSLDIKKMKKLHKNGYTCVKIAKVMKITEGIVNYHVSPTQNSQESLEKRRKKIREYNKWRYNNDPEFRQKILNSNAKSRKRRIDANDSKYIKWMTAVTKKNYPKWILKQQKLHPTWSRTCCNGGHETTNYTHKCLNVRISCKCPCHYL